jgi:hypothetical protein
VLLVRRWPGSLVNDQMNVSRYRLLHDVCVRVRFDANLMTSSSHKVECRRENGRLDKSKSRCSFHLGFADVLA